MIDLIHIGDYKTGTSWWQSQALPSHPEIYYLDNPHVHPEIVHLMHRLVDSRDLDFDADSLREKFSGILEDLDCKGQKKVVCREVLSGTYPAGDHARRTAERLHAVFGKVKILIVIREQFSMLKAAYSEYVKMGGTLGFDSFVYDPVVSPGLIERLKYHKIIDMYKSLFGSDHVYVGLFEEFRADNARFARQVFQFAGCSGDWHSPSQKTIVNPSLRKPGIEIQRFINRFLRNDFNPRMPLIPLDKLAAIFLSSETKKKLLDGTRNRLVYSRQGCDDAAVLRYAINFALTLHVSKLCQRIRFGPRLRIPDDIMEELGEEFVESNRVLREKHGLPVDEFGWSL